MNEKDVKVARARIYVKKAQIVLQEKKEKMDRGIVEAQAIFDAKVAGLKSEWLQAQTELEQELLNVKEAEEIVGGPN